jgi:hypothetical protein
MLHLTGAHHNYVEAAEVSANFLTINFTFNVFYWSPCVLWVYHMVIITYPQIGMREFNLEQIILLTDLQHSQK